MTRIHKNAVDCSTCAFKVSCGGQEDPELSMLGCFNECVLHCDQTCDLTCPNNQELFANRMREIDGNFDFSSSPLKAPVGKLSRYIPKIHNGVGRVEKLAEKMVVIPIRELLSVSKSNILCRFKNPEDIREFFCLSYETKYIISCVSTDEDVEIVWEGAINQGLSESIAKLMPSAVITPNFSFFIYDVPRTHTIWNRKRICMAAQTFSDSGCLVIVPLSARNRNDWEFWYRFLNENPKMKYVAKEFQTGLKNPELATLAIEDLSKIQDRLNRPLHPLALGGGKYVAILKKHFDNYTVIDSRAFMTAVNRRAITYPLGKYKEQFSSTDPGEPIDQLLNANIREKRTRYL